MRIPPLFPALLILTFFIPASHAAISSASLEATSPDSLIVGSVQANDVDGGVRIRVRVGGAPPGLHGIHIHENGSCEDGGKGAGGHFNPLDRDHGFLPKDGLAGSHPGDMGNIEVDSGGTGHLDILLPGLSVNQGDYSVSGRAVILHEKEDDFGQPTGNAGGRIACGILS